MAFSDADIISVNPPIQRGGDLYLVWTSSAPSGTNYQIYVDRVLRWYGTSTSATIPLPQGIGWFDIGTVGAGEATEDFSSGLSGPNNRATLGWIGGTFEAPDIAGFHVYGETTPGGGIQYDNVLGDIPAYTRGAITDGWGFGEWDLGGWGFASATYGWESDPLTSGSWNWAVIPYDMAGNEGVSVIASTVIAVPPGAPARDSGGIRLHYTYDPSTFEVTLNWLPSPG